MVKSGDKVHYWSRQSPGIARDARSLSSKCHRCIIREVSADGKWAMVERLNSQTAVPVQQVATSRLKPGWNNWTDQEGRIIE